MSTCFLIIDIQNDYFSGGGFPLARPESAADAARTILEHFRAAHLPVVHVMHLADSRRELILRPGTDGARIHIAVAPIPGEPVIEKTHPNAFRGTSLSDTLDRLEVTELVVAGMTTSMCVDATVRAAADAGYAVTVISDACAAPDVEFGGRHVPAVDVQAAYLASLAEEYAKVVTSDEYLG
jgi:nicotinamidase-related amidase